MPRPARDQALDPPASALGRGEISADSLVEATRQIAALAGAGLPLPSGLEALARELPVRSPIRRMLGRVAVRIQGGAALDEALEDEGDRFPSSLRGLISAGLRSGRLADSLGRFLDVYELGRALRAQLAMSLIYPTLLFLVAFALFVLSSVLASNGFESTFADFGLDLPWVTRQMLTVSRSVVGAGAWLAAAPVLGVAIVWLTMKLTLDPAERVKMLHWVPILGPLARYTALAQFCPILATLVETDVPLPEALKLAGESSRDAGMAAAARAMAGRVEAGESLGDAVGDRPPFPRGFGKFLAWAETNRGLVEALRMSSETFESQARTQATFIAKFCNMVSVVFVLWWVGLTVVSLYLPMIQLMNAISGWGPAPPSSDWGWIGTLAAMGLMGVVGVAGVFTLVWPLIRRGYAFTVKPSRDRPEARPRFWFLSPMGWTLMGLTLVALLVLRFLNAMGAGDWLPDWWIVEVWPNVEYVGILSGFLGLALVLFEYLASRFERSRADLLLKAQTRAGRTRFRLPAWRFGLRHMMFGMAPLAILFVLARELGWALLTQAVMISPPLVVVGAYVILSGRRTLDRDGLLQVMAMASSRDQPLAPAIEAFAPSCRGSYRRKVVDLAVRLDAGDPLPQALDRTPGVLTRTGGVVARVGWETGTLGRMLDDAVAASASLRAARVAAIGSIAYPVLVLSAIAGVGAFLLLFVGERFSSIFKDFGVELPEPSRTILAFCRDHFPSTREAGVAGILAVGTTLVVLALILLTWFVGGRVLRWIPLGDRLIRRLHAAVILRALAAGIESGQTLPSILARLSAAYPRAWVKKRLVRASARVERGEEWASALQAEGLITRVDESLIRSAERAGNLPWALREAAGSGERRFSYRIQAMGQILQPLSIVAMGGLVMLLAFTYFVPLITLIESLTDVNL